MPPANSQRPSDQERAAPAKKFPFWQSLPLAILLFALWIVLSGKLDAFHLGAGLVSVVAVSWLSSRLFELRPAIGPQGRHPAVSVPWHRFVGYFPWLAWQILIATVQVTRLIWSPKLPIHPQLVRFHCRLPHNMARATLANSITLTPGTVTLDVQGDEYLVHALTKEGADAIYGEDGLRGGEMGARVARLFTAAEEAR